MDRLLKLFRALGFTWCWSDPHVTDYNSLKKFHTRELPMFLVMGPSCSGKTTIARFLQEASGYDLVEISDLIEQERKTGSYRAQLIVAYNKLGDQPAREIVVSLIKEYISKSHTDTKGYIFCGFPVSLKEANLFQLEIGRFNVAIYCSVPKDLYLQRNADKYLELLGTKFEKKYQAEHKAYQLIYRLYENKVLKIFTDLPIEDNQMLLLADLHDFWGYKFNIM